MNSHQRRVHRRLHAQASRAFLDLATTEQCSKLVFEGLVGGESELVLRVSRGKQFRYRVTRAQLEASPDIAQALAEAREEREAEL